MTIQWKKPTWAVVSCTGHRPPKHFGYDFRDKTREAIRENVKRILSRIQEKEPKKKVALVTGGAIGFDQDALAAGIELGDVYTVMAIPCINQEKLWNRDDIQRYYELMTRCSKIIHVSDKPYNPTCMWNRNKWMVDRADIMLACWDQKFGKGGTASCMSYAFRVNKEFPLIVIDPRNGNISKVANLPWPKESK